MALRSTAAGRAQYMAFQAAGGHLIHEPEPAPAPSPRLSELLLAGPEEVRNLAIAAGIWSMPTISPEPEPAPEPAPEPFNIGDTVAWVPGLGRTPVKMRGCDLFVREV